SHAHPGKSVGGAVVVVVARDAQPFLLFSRQPIAWLSELGSGRALSAACRVSFQELGLAPLFAEEVACTGTQSHVALHLARGPGDLGIFGAGGVAQAEVQSRVACGLEAAPPSAPGDEAPATGDDRDPGANGVAVGAATLQAESERPAALGPVVKVGYRLVV